MKTFFYTAKYILKTIDNDYKEYTDHGIIAGASYTEAMSQVEEYYGSEELYELKLVALRDDGITLLPELPGIDLEGAITEANFC